MEMGFMISLIVLGAATALSGVGSAAGGEDIETANEALGDERISVTPGSEASTTADGTSPTAGTGAGGSSGSFGSATEGITSTGMSGAFHSDPSIGGYWNTHHAGNTVGDDWEVVSGSVDARVDHNGRFDMAVEGQFMDLNGHGAGHVKRTIDILPNAHYNLSVDIGENVYGGPAVKRMQIIWNGEVVSTLDINIPAEEIETFTVQLPPLPTEQGVLEFKSLLGSAHGPLIDNPTLTYIPDRD
ncbi:MAG: hypothetical protein AAGC53_09605 [Actinomycetota bacterium]